MALGKDILKQIKSLPSVVPGALGKVFFKKKLKKILAKCRVRGTRQSIFQKKIAECQIWDTRQRNFKKNLNLCRVPDLGHSAKKFFKKKNFAECLTAGTRQRRTWPNTITRVILFRAPRFCRESGTRQRSPLPSVFFCRVQLFAECSTRQRRSLPSARFLTLSKEFCTRQSLYFQ